MPQVPLLSGAYQSRSIIAGAQQCVNLFPEVNPQGSQSPTPVTHYPTPGLTAIAQLADTLSVRGVYVASNGEFYAICGPSIYRMSSDYTITKIGTIPNRSTPVSMKDNGLVLLIVDGTSNGYCIDLTNPARTFGQISDSVFTGGVKVDYIDTYFVVNVPNSGLFQLSVSNVTYTLCTSGTSGAAFNPLYIVQKSGGADPVSTLICVHREIWVLGTKTSEVWIDQGTPDIPIGELPGTFIEHGCVAPYSVAAHDNMPFWLSQDRDGRNIVAMGENYAAKRISTHALEDMMSKYKTVSDAIGFVYQIVGHVFYALTFPSQDVTWCYEIASGLWHQWASVDQNGVLHRHRANCHASNFNINIVGDWQNGTLYALDPNVFTDNGSPILRIRTFPHLINDGKQVIYTSFIADMQVGEISGEEWKASNTAGGAFSSGFSIGFTANETTVVPKISLRYSDTRGASWSNRVLQDMGATGQYNTSVKWSRLGKARDRVFELSWDAPVNTALNGAFIEMIPTNA